MPCQAPPKLSVPSCQGPQTDKADATGLIFCPACKRMRQQYLDSVQRQKTRETSRVGFIKNLLNQPGLTGASLQKQATARTEQVLIDLFNECSTGTAPADFAFMACGSMARREMVTYSDIDAVLVLSNGDTASRNYYEAVLQRVEDRLVVAGRSTNLVSGANHTNFRFCPTGLSPLDFLGTIGELIDNALEADEGAHVRGALFTRMIMGDRRWGDAYTLACQKALGLGGRHKREALLHLTEVLEKKNGEFKLPAADDFVVNAKTQIYRPTHMIVNELALYYGIQVQGTREQIVALTEANHMSLPVANLLMELLESYAKVMTAHQAKMGEEFHLVRLRDGKNTDPPRDVQDFGVIPKAPPFQVGAIQTSVARLTVLWNMAEEFYRQKSKTGPFAKKRNPFMASNPWADFGGGLRP